jgi:hypothetical protein
VTERWRKKLEGIDQVGPSDDVFDRAKTGPALPEPRSPMQRTSTRVVTAIAAFVIFALGISVFAIPALRLGGNDQFVSAGNQIQPLWPWSSTDQVKAWKDDPQSVGTSGVSSFQDPGATAAAFGHEVFGWIDVSAHEEGTPQTFPCSGAVAYQGMSSPPPTGGGELCSVVSPGQSAPPTLVPYAPTTAAPAFRTFDLSTCPPDSTCDYIAPGAPNVHVTVYQPIGADGPWAVLQATSDYIGISLGPGTALHDGSTIYASGVVPNETHAVVGYHVSSSGCGESGSTGGFEAANQDAGSDLNGGLSFGTYSRGQLDLQLSTQDPSCEQQAGYVFVIASRGNVTTTDPLAGLSGDAGVIVFAAVPVSFVFPSVQDSSGPSPSTSPPIGLEPGWTTYTDPIGWTIDVPATWNTEQETNQRVRFLGDGLAVEISPFGVSDTDDSPIPLDPSTFLTQGEGGLIGNVRGDGSAYGFAVFSQDGGFMSLDRLSSAQGATLDHMIASITFPASKLGEGQDGWTAIAPLLQSASAEWVVDKLTGNHYLASITGKGTRVLFGPAPACPGGGGSYEVRETGVAGVACPDGTGGDWDFTTGQPLPGSSAGFDTPLDVHDAVRSWDGWLLARIAPTPSPSPTG